MNCECCRERIDFVPYKTAREGKCDECTGEHDRNHRIAPADAVRERSE